MLQTTKALTPEQVAEILQINQAMVYQMIKRGELLAKKIGRLYRISPVALSWLITGKDWDVLQMEKEDQPYLLQINKLLKKIRRDENRS